METTIQKIFNSYSEFQSILSLLKSNYEVNETIDVVEIRIIDEIKLPILLKLNDVIEKFEVFCNPFSSDLFDIIDDIQKGSTDVNEIESVSILLEKNRIFESDGNLDYFFFDAKEALKMLPKMESLEDVKINIGIPGIANIETETAVFYSLHIDFVLEDIARRPIDKIVENNIIFYLSNNKKTNQTTYNNPYSFIIIDGKFENND
ncbi:hypothetical protein, partial [Lysinibacillus capsici]|uniref:hypothetical protein n=1 Tax=Lysinibacillus capsici TaxID=2115968 RepID=UPI002A7F14ED